MSQPTATAPTGPVYIVAKDFVSAKRFADSKGWKPGEWNLLDDPIKIKGVNHLRVFTLPGAWINPDYRNIMQEVRVRPGVQIVYVEV